jgi:endonuclease-3
MDVKKIERMLEIFSSKLNIDLQSWNKNDPFHVLIGTVLSQRTKDENTEKADKQLFSKYKTPEEIANAPLKDLEMLIKPSGFYRVKAKRIKEISKIIAEKYNGKVPETINELIKLPGVGRKTAGCVLVYGFNRPAIPTDVHVFRVSNRVGIVKEKTPEKTEQALMKVIPKKYWIAYNSIMVRFGQQICRPIRSRCWECPIVEMCEYGEKNFIK